MAPLAAAAVAAAAAECVAASAAAAAAAPTHVPVRGCLASQKCLQNRLLGLHAAGHHLRPQAHFASHLEPVFVLYIVYVYKCVRVCLPHFLCNLCWMCVCVCCVCVCVCECVCV